MSGLESQPAYATISAFSATLWRNNVRGGGTDVVGRMWEDVVGRGVASGFDFTVHEAQTKHTVDRCRRDPVLDFRFYRHIFLKDIASSFSLIR